MKRFFSSILFVCIALTVIGQYDPKENYYDGEFFFAEEDYQEALYAFNQVYNAGFEDNANINYRIGVCLLNIENRETEAIPYLEKAVKNITDKYREGNFNEEEAPRDALLYLANAYRYDSQFSNALEFYNAYIDYGEIENEVHNIFAKKQIEACKRAENAVKSKSPVNVGTLGQINEIRVPVFNPVVSGDLSTIAFMGRQKFYNGVYISRNKDGKWTKPYNITPSIQSDGNQTVLSLSHDGNQLLLAWYDGFESNIWISEYSNDRWNISKPMPDPINSRFFESHACFTSDGETIYFASNRRESLGGMDIFRSTKEQDGSWGDIELLGENINTPLNEESPFISPDGNRLYFSSQGHDGLGGFDVFYCDIMEDGTFGKPVNLNYPLNTPENDLAYTPEVIEYDQYLTLYAKGPTDQVDLFRFEWIPENASPVAVAFETPMQPEKEDQTQESPDEQVAEQVEAEEEPQSEEVAEKVSTPAQEEVPEVQEEDVVEEDVVEEEIEEETSKKPDTDAIIKQLKMIRPVYFSFDDYSLSETATRKLDDIISILERFPGIEIEIIGHTDAIGASDYNKMLSNRRSQSVADYFESKGISRDRMKVSGVGEADHIAINRTSDNRDAPRGRALNRRVHFNTTVPGGVFLEIEEVEIPDELKVR